MVEPFWSSRVDGKVRNDLSADAVIKSVGVCSALGRTSAYTWMKLPVVPEMERVMDSTTFPTLLLGGDPDTSPEETFASWRAALQLPVGARPGRRPHPALPGRRRRRRRRRHRRRHGPLTGDIRNRRAVSHREDLSIKGARQFYDDDHRSRGGSDPLDGVHLQRRRSAAALEGRGAVRG